MIIKLRQTNSFRFICLLILFSLLCSNNPCQAISDWTKINQELKKKVFRLNIGLKIRLKNNLWVQVTDLSPKNHYYVFTTSKTESGYQIISHGSCFPLSTSIHQQRESFFVTSYHVLTGAEEIKQECEMFYAGLELYTRQTAHGHNIESHYQELLNTINLAKKSAISIKEKNLYQNTVDAVWDCYDTYLSKRADPASILFNKYKKLANLEIRTGYFLHGATPIPFALIEVYKIPPSIGPDLAILTANSVAAQAWVVDGLSLDQHEPLLGQDIEVIGFPMATDSMDTRPLYNPTFQLGKITRTSSQIIEFNASVDKGNSGGPVISKTGKVLAVVTSKSLLSTTRDDQFTNYGCAIRAQILRTFIPELLDNTKEQKPNPTYQK